MTERLDTLLRAACAARGEAAALADAQGTMSYAALAAAAGRVAAALAAAGIEDDEPVLVACANAPEDIAAFIGVWQAGGVAVPVSRAAPAAATEATRAATGARFIVTGETLAKAAEAPPAARPILKDAALIIFTSGSTGAPKGVVLGHAAFAAKLKEIDASLGFTPETRSLVVLQITFVFGIWVTLLTLLRGGTAFMAPRFEPVATMADAAAWKITDAAFVPTMLRKILAADPAKIAAALGDAALRRIHTGGEPFSPALGERLRALFPRTDIIDIYGLTETASSDFFLFTQAGEGFKGGIGRISKSERFRIADADGRPVADGEPGELQIATPFIMNGYLDRPDLTEAAFADNYFRTGDLARVRGDGMVELVGRAKEIIMRAGAKISPLELDHTIAQHPAVAAALTVGIADAVVGERIHVLVVPRADGAVSESELKQWAAARLERYKQPDTYHFGSELPTGRTGKVDREALRRSIAGN